MNTICSSQLLAKQISTNTLETFITAYNTIMTIKIQERYQLKETFTQQEYTFIEFN